MSKTKTGPYDRKTDYAGRAALRELVRKVCAVDGRDKSEMLDVFVRAWLESLHPGVFYEAELELEMQLHEADELRALSKEVFELLTGREFAPADGYA